MITITSSIPLSAAAVDTEAAALGNLNSLLRRCGLYLSTASTQLHVMPETVCVISPSDVSSLAQNARLLVTHKDVQCDFNALSSVLWGHVKNIDARLDAYLQYLQKTPDVRKTAAVYLSPRHVSLLAHAVFTLQQFEEPYARHEVRDAVSVVQKDVEMVARLGTKLIRVLRGALEGQDGSDVNLLPPTEMALGTVFMFAVSMASRSAIDVSPITTFFNSEITWELSGVSIFANESYCEALYRLISVLFARRSDFDGIERVSAELLVNRLAARPPLNWNTVKRLQSLRNVALSPQYVVLRYISAVRHRVLLLLAPEAPIANMLRPYCARILQEFGKRKQMISYYQVTLLGALHGMPEVNLTDDAQLCRRAMETHLGDDEQLMRPDFLRLLMAHGHTVAHDEHCALSHGSVISLFRAMCQQLFQAPFFESDNFNDMSDLVLRPPVIALSLIRLVVRASSADVSIASDVLDEMNKLLNLMYKKSLSQCGLAQSPRRVPKPLRRVILGTTTLLFEFFKSRSFIEITNRVASLQALARIVAMWGLYVTSERSTAEAERKSAMRLLSVMNRKLVAISAGMTVAGVNGFFKDVVLPSGSKESLAQRNHQHYALLEAYLRAFASDAIVIVMNEELLLKQWVDLSLRCIKNPLSGALAIAGLDFLSAVFLSKRAIAPLFVPTYISLMIPTLQSSRYGNPPLFLARHFAKTVRACCQALEECDERALKEIIDDPNSTVSKVVTSVCGNDQGLVSLDNVRPLSSVLLIVSSLFDEVCILLGNTSIAIPTATQQRLARFQVYYSALINLLQCRSNTTLHRVCASVEAVMMEQLRGVPSVQAQWIKYIGRTVDSLQGVGKKAVAEWFLMLSEKVKKIAPHAQL
uniref:Uncharacterized protein TCIL3000_10_8480 n=1 Tax=Trypanosoma congolense (strain IL3000) TaxID=1068625 RepID=G0UXF5_TRYCI|nr:unnamed protein product [Trypanosoma congolense IL3000]